MNRNAWIVLALGILLIGGIYLYGKKSPESYLNTNATTTAGTTTDNVVGTTSAALPPSEIHPYGRTDIKVGEKVNYPSGSVKILSVDEDSRCATGVQCIWAGTVKTTMEYSLNGVTKKATLELNKSITRGNEKITLVGVSPNKISGKDINQSDYTFTIEVIKTLVSNNPPSGSPTVKGGCFVGGCSSEVCSDQKDVVSNCIYSPKYACYKNATCERQQNGQCGWTQTSELQMCLANAG